MAKELEHVRMAPSPARAMRAPEWLYRWRRAFHPRWITLDGFRCVGYRQDMARHVSSLLARGDYEAPERLAIQRVLRSNDRVLEGGACVGIVAMTAARIVGAENVLSYEPNPCAAAAAEENFRRNGLAIALRKRGLAPRPGQATFSFSNGSWLGGSARRTNGDHFADVPVDGIADVVRSFRPTVLVLDVEGMEADLLTACPLQGLRAIIVEWHHDILDHDRIRALRERLHDAGLELRPELSLEGTEVFLRMSQPDQAPGPALGAVS